MMYDHEKSDSAIVAVKLTNKAGKPATESVEPRAGPRGTCVSKARAGHSTGDCVTGAGTYTEFESIRAPLDTRGGSRMPEMGSYGSVRGAVGNSRPYREPPG